MPTTARSTSPSTCTTPPATCARATDRGCGPITTNALTALDLIRLLLDRGANPNKVFIGQLHSASLCCGDDVNASPFYRAAIASDVEVIKLMLAKGAKVEWSPSEVKKEGDSGTEAAAPPGAAPMPTSARRR